MLLLASGKTNVWFLFVFAVATVKLRVSLDLIIVDFNLHFLV